MLLADGSAALLTDASDIASYEAPSPADSGPGLTELEVTVQHLLSAVSRVRAVLGVSRSLRSSSVSQPMTRTTE